MRDAQVSVGEAPADRHHLHVGAVIANVIANLFEATQGGEVANRIREDDLAGERHAGGQADHVLLRHPGVDELVGVLLRELLDHREAKVTHHKTDTWVSVGELVERLDERRPHEAATSASAVTSSSGVGAR